MRTINNFLQNDSLELEKMLEIFFWISSAVKMLTVECDSSLKKDLQLLLLMLYFIIMNLDFEQKNFVKINRILLNCLVPHS